MTKKNFKLIFEKALKHYLKILPPIQMNENKAGLMESQKQMNSNQFTILFA